MSPGTTSFPAASIRRGALPCGRLGATAATRPSRIPRSKRPERPAAGSIRVPPVTMTSWVSPAAVCAVMRSLPSPPGRAAPRHDRAGNPRHSGPRCVRWRAGMILPCVDRLGRRGHRRRRGDDEDDGRHRRERSARREREAPATSPTPCRIEGRVAERERRTGESDGLRDGIRASVLSSFTRASSHIEAPSRPCARITRPGE